MIGYKFLRADGTSPFSDFRWELPSGRPGPWVEADVDPCSSGIHACRAADLPYWAGHSLFEIELDGEILELGSKQVASRARLLRRIEVWEEKVRDDYQRMCADRAHALASSATPPLSSWDALVDPFAAQGPGPAGFAAARIAEEVNGPDAYRTERAAQAAWLIERLGLEA